MICPPATRQAVCITNAASAQLSLSMGLHMKSIAPSARLVRVSQALLTGLAVAGCAVLNPPPAAPAGTAPAAPAAVAAAPGASAPPARFASQATVVATAASAASAPSAARADPSAGRPFDEVVKGATLQAGFVPV